mmetsp:Transcript_16966/g.51473  ORF Transcript_16966/g.51473 Transcript_16966/m.51473 type:complete len:276 (+) Transcript_16966:266-1093(+)
MAADEAERGAFGVLGELVGPAHEARVEVGEALREPDEAEVQGRRERHARQAEGRGVDVVVVEPDRVISRARLRRGQVLVVRVVVLDDVDRRPLVALLLRGDGGVVAVEDVADAQDFPALLVLVVGAEGRAQGAAPAPEEVREARKEARRGGRVVLREPEGLRDADAFQKKGGDSQKGGPRSGHVPDDGARPAGVGAAGGAAQDVAEVLEEPGVDLVVLSVVLERRRRRRRVVVPGGRVDEDLREAGEGDAAEDLEQVAAGPDGGEAAEEDREVPG